jgi:hypothetical protein
MDPYLASQMAQIRMLEASRIAAEARAAKAAAPERPRSAHRRPPRRPSIQLGRRHATGA